MNNLTTYITEKLKISSKSIFYSCQPQTRKELRKILEERLSEDKNANLNDIDVSEITYMGRDERGVGLFEDLDPHNIDISEWNVSNVQDMNFMFGRCENFNCDLSEWNVSKVDNMTNMFYNCKNFTGEGLENWDVSYVDNMASMFKDCINFDCDFSKWNVTKVYSMYAMFIGCLKFKGKGLENWDVSNVEDMQCIFVNCTSLKNKPSWYHE